MKNKKLKVKTNMKVKDININIKNENNQQSKNKYIEPPPDMNKNVPMAYQPYNSIQTNLWNDPETAAKLEERGYTRAVRRPQVYEGPFSQVPLRDDEDVVATEAEMTQEVEDVEDVVDTEVEAAPQPASPPAAAGPPAPAQRRPRLLEIERTVFIKKTNNQYPPPQTLRDVSDEIRATYRISTGRTYDGNNKIHFANWVYDFYELYSL